ncbi:hypothetical protein DRP04_14890, partial [Archaeoglobales archaeon]
MQVSKEYVEFVKSLLEKKSLIEEVFSIFGFLRFCPSFLRKKYREAIEFAHIRNTPEEIFSSGIVIPLIILVVGILAAVFVNSSFVLFLTLVFAGMAAFYILQYPFIKAQAFKMKATSEMMLAVIYIGVSMKVSPNLERAIYFAASNLRGPLAKDLAKVLWDVYVGRHYSLTESLDTLIEKWKHENEEFVEAMTIIKNASASMPERITVAVDEAISLMLEESERVMEKQVRRMKSPLIVLNAFGILMPILAMMFMPLVSVFVPEMFDFPIVAVTYTILLPWGLYWFISTYLQRRPYTFHQPELSHGKFKKFDYLAIGIGTVIFLSFSVLLLPKILYGEEKLLPSIIYVFGIGLSIASYLLVSSYFKLQFRNKIVQIEKEIGEFVFMLSMALTGGGPVEQRIESLKEKAKSLSIRELLDALIYNIRVFGMSLRRALLDSQSGIIVKYPSRIISAVMKAIAEISTRGTYYLSQALLSISKYLKNMRKVEDVISEELSEITLNMRLQAWLLAPLTCGIVVALMAVITQILIQIEGLYEKLSTSISSASEIGATMFSQFINFGKLVGPWLFQLVVGIYMIEAVLILSYFVTKIEHGEEP